MGARILKDYYPDYSLLIAKKAGDAYNFGLSDTGACQTAPCGAPYFYEEDNWTDDMELAAAPLYRLTGKQEFIHKSTASGTTEPNTTCQGDDNERPYNRSPLASSR